MLPRPSVVCSSSTSSTAGCDDGVSVRTRPAAAAPPPSCGEGPRRPIITVVRKDDAVETLDHLHEIVDERFEAGPAPYVVERMTLAQVGSDDWAVEVVYE